MSETSLSVESFWEQYAGQPYELVRGNLSPLRPTGSRASEVAIAAAAELYNYVKKTRAGRVTGANGAYALSATCLRVPDVGFYVPAKAVQITDPRKYLPFAPDLVVEVVSPEDRAGNLMETVLDYLEAGTALVWVIYPDLRSVAVHMPNYTTKLFSADGVLDGGDLLSDLQIAVADLFPNNEDAL